MMFGRTCDLNAVKVVVPPPSRYFHLFAAGVALRHECGYISSPLSHFVSPVVRELAGGGPKLDGRCGIRNKCPRARGR